MGGGRMNFDLIKKGVKMPKKVLLILFSYISFNHLSVFASISSTAKVFGKVVKVDKNEVELSQKNKNGKTQKIKVQKKNIPKYFKVQTGQCVYAVVGNSKVNK